MLELRKDFAKIIGQLDITNIKNQLESTFNKKIGDVEQRLTDQERALSNQFNDLMKSAEIQLQKAVDQKIHESQNEFARVVDLKIQDTAKTIGNGIDSQLKFAKEN